MAVPNDPTRRWRLFERLDGIGPDAWTASELGEGINQPHHFRFVRQGWARVAAEDDDSWVEEHIRAAKANPGAPVAGIGLVLDRLVAAGVWRDDLTDVVGGMQGEPLFDLCDLVDDPSRVDVELADIRGSLVEIDGEWEPTDRAMGGLHESVLETDPTGRERRPRKAA